MPTNRIREGPGGKGVGSSELMMGPPNPENIGAFRSRIRLCLPVILTLLPLSRSPEKVSEQGDKESWPEAKYH